MRVVLTGGPSSGKSSIISELRSRGYTCVDEAARQVLEERKGHEETQTEQLARQKRIFERQISDESKAHPLVFFDRGLVDTIAYCKFFFGELPSELSDYENQARVSRYDAIFLCEPLPFVNDGLRREKDPAEAVSLHNCLLKTYLEWGYSPINVPVFRGAREKSIAQRADLILSHIQQMKGGDLKWEDVTQTGHHVVHHMHHQKKVAKPRARPNPRWQQQLRSFVRSHELSDLLAADKAFFRSRKKGFIAQLAAFSGIDVADIPKEFPDTEYEVKFDIQPTGKGEEPTVIQYLDAFDFPVGGSTRFIKDPVNNFAVGVNHFIGDSLDERLVVIEKAGKTFLKEKGRVVPLDTGVAYQEIVVKRTEERHESPMGEVIERVRQVTSEQGVQYRGKIRKEKGDVFVLDSNDGRIYSFTITRAHLTRPDEQAESAIQRQLEIEYAGYIPGFKGFQKDSEKQVIEGMVDLAKYTFAMYNNAPIANGWRMGLQVTGQRKYDFILGKAAEPVVFPMPVRQRQLVALKGE